MKHGYRSLLSLGTTCSDWY